MSAPARNAATCLFWDTPPKMVVTLNPLAEANGCSTAVIWVANSRVGASTRPVGRFGRQRCSLSAATSGNENASVLPLPVLPRPSTSRPDSESGSVAAWMGNGVVMSLAASARTRGAGTPRSAKVWVVMCAFPAFGRCVPG